MTEIGRSQMLDPVPCPECGKMLSGAAGVNHNERPSPGDKTVCAHCGAALVYGEGLSLALPTPQQAQEMLGSHLFLATFFAVWCAHHGIEAPQ